MKSKRLRPWAFTAVYLSLAAHAIAYLAIPAASEIGLPVPQEVAMAVRGGATDSVCSWFKSAECAEVVQSSDFTSCPAQTYYHRDAQGTDYVKNDGMDYCGTQREGDPEVYDCASVMVDTAGCAK